MKYVKPELEDELLDVIMSTKLQGRALMNFEIKDIRSFEQLKNKLESFYYPKRNPALIQIEFNHLKQRPGESAVEYGARADHLAMQLYESLTDSPGKTPQDKRTILDTVKHQALQNFVYGLREDIRMVIRAQRYATLQEAIEGAKAEEKLKRPRDSAYNANKSFNNLKAIQCHKCGKQGHHGRDCRTSRYGNQFTLPKPSGSRFNTLDKHCNYCKKSGHNRTECWILNGKPEYTKNKKINEESNTRNTINKTNKHRETEDDDAERKTIKATAKTVREHKVLTADEINHAHTELNLISLPMNEVIDNKINMLIDTGATMSLIKLNKLKDETIIYDKKITIIGATGHKADTIGVMQATIPLKTRDVKHELNVIKDNFPIEYDGILGADFLQKYQASWDYTTKKLRINKNLFTLFPCKKFTLEAKLLEAKLL
ncbi:uncharacterized protein [Linepithema humile]|uniref:uncharacterized protein n=1 Tax=Linepithema humile TaxID=83485 RepID=UPI00351EED08